MAEEVLVCSEDKIRLIEGVLDVVKGVLEDKGLVKFEDEIGLVEGVIEFSKSKELNTME